MIVISGKDNGKSGKVLRVDPAKQRVYVEGLNIIKRHTKPRQSAGATDRMPKMQQGGILDLAQPLPIGKVMLVCSFQILVRWSLPRFRYDQVLRFAWKFMFPLALANLLVTAVVVWALQS